MKKFIKLTSLILAVVLTATVGLAGCGGSSSGKKTTNEKGQVEIRVSLPDGNISEQASELLKDYAEKNPNITFKEEPIVGEYTSKLITQASAGTAPDLVWVSDINTRLLASKGLLTDLSQYYKTYNFDSSDVYEAMLECGQYAGKQYMIPRDFSQVITYYNKALFDEVGVAYPEDGWTWEQFVETASKFAKKSNSGKVYVRRGCDANLNWGATAPIILLGLGGTLTDVFPNGKSANMNTSGTVKALKEIKQLVDDGALVNNYKNDIGSFTSGKIAMVFQTRSVCRTYSHSLGEKLGVTTFPILPEKHMVGSGTSGYAVMSTSEHKEEAAGFAFYVISEEGQKVFSATGDCVPVLKSLANDDTWKNSIEGLAWEPFVDSTDACVLQPSITVGSDAASTQFDSCWTEMFSACLTGVYTAEKSAEYGNQKLEQAFQER